MNFLADSRSFFRLSNFSFPDTNTSTLLALYIGALPTECARRINCKVSGGRLSSLKLILLRGALF